MKRMISTVLALLLAGAPIAATAQQGTAQQAEDDRRMERDERRSAPHRAGEGPGGRHVMGGHHMMEGRHMMGPMRMMFILIDSDGDGALSLEEARTAQERIFRAVDQDEDDRVTPEEIRAFMRGMSRPDPE